MKGAIRRIYPGHICTALLLLGASISAGEAVAQGRYSKELEKREQESQEAYQRAYDLALDEKWSEASAAFDALRKRFATPTSVTDDAAFWYCYAREKSGAPGEEVYACYESFAQAYPQSNWKDDATTGLIRVGKALGEEGKPSYTSRVQALQKSEDEQIAMTAIYALAERGNDASIPPLVNAANTSSSIPVRVAVAQALSKIGTPAARETLTRLARDERHGPVQAEAVLLLAERGDDSALPVFQDVLKASPHLEARRYAISALHRVNTPAAKDVLLQALRTERNPMLLSGLIQALTEQGNDALVPELAAVLELSGDGQVGRDAVHALQRIGTPRAIQVITGAARNAESPHVRQMAARALVVGGGGVVPVLVEVAKGDSDAHVRRAAVEALGQINAPAAQQALAEILRVSTGN